MRGRERERMNSLIVEEEKEKTCISSSTSSIGENNSFGSNAEDLAERRLRALSNLDALEEALPIRRGISNFYNGKSKSFTSLADLSASSPSIKDIAKQDNAYTRRRRNLLASKNLCLKSPSTHLKGGISKKSSSNVRSSPALAMAMSKEEPLGKTSLEKNPALHSSSSSSPQYCSIPMRSLSPTDLKKMDGSGSGSGSGSGHKELGSIGCNQLISDDIV